MTLLVVSPHLDDAVLSCAGAIYAHARRGRRVVVATVFSEGRDAARRQDEDRAAVASLGAEPLHLGLLDAPERLGIARTHRALVWEAAILEADVSAVHGAIEATIERVQATCILVPLGVGDHVDHRVVHAAMRDRAGVVVYEDRPYSFLAGATRARLSALGLRVRNASTDLAAAPDPAVVREQLVSLAHLRAYLPDDDDDDDDDARERARLASKLCESNPTDALADAVAVVTAHDEETAAAAAAAIGLYESQIADLFGDRIGIAAALRAASPSAPHAERTFARMSK